MIGVRRSYGGCKRNRQSDPLVEVKNFGKNQKVGSWTEQLVKRAKEKKRGQNPKTSYAFLYHFHFHFPNSFNFILNFFEKIRPMKS